MVKFFKKAGWVLFGLLMGVVLTFLSLMGFKKRKDLILFKDKFKKKIKDLEQKESHQLEKIKSKANQNRAIIENTIKISDKKKRLQKLAEMVNKNDFSSKSQNSDKPENSSNSNKP